MCYCQHRRTRSGSIVLEGSFAALHTTLVTLIQLWVESHQSTHIVVARQVRRHGTDRPLAGVGLKMTAMQVPLISPTMMVVVALSAIHLFDDHDGMR